MLRPEDMCEDDSSMKVDQSDLTEDELIAKVVEKLRPTIKDLVEKEKSGDKSSGAVTSSRY